MTNQHNKTIEYSNAFIEFQKFYFKLVKNLEFQFAIKLLKHYIKTTNNHDEKNWCMQYQRCLSPYPITTHPEFKEFDTTIIKYSNDYFYVTINGLSYPIDCLGENIGDDLISESVFNLKNSIYVMGSYGCNVTLEEIKNEFDWITSNLSDHNILEVMFELKNYKNYILYFNETNAIPTPKEIDCLLQCYLHTKQFEQGIQYSENLKSLEEFTTNQLFYIFWLDAQSSQPKYLEKIINLLEKRNDSKSYLQILKLVKQFLLEDHKLALSEYSALDLNTQPMCNLKLLMCVFFPYFEKHQMYDEILKFNNVVFVYSEHLLAYVKALKKQDSHEQEWVKIVYHYYLHMPELLTPEICFVAANQAETTYENVIQDILEYGLTLEQKDPVIKQRLMIELGEVYFRKQKYQLASMYLNPDLYTINVHYQHLIHYAATNVYFKRNLDQAKEILNRFKDEPGSYGVYECYLLLADIALYENNEADIQDYLLILQIHHSFVLDSNYIKNVLLPCYFEKNIKFHRYETALKKLYEEDNDE